jgi:hypothetical protein
VDRPSLDDPHEAAELGDVELGVGDLAIRVQVDGDLVLWPLVQVMDQ